MLYNPRFTNGGIALQLEKQGNKFRVVTQEFSTNWLPDNLWNRKVVLVMLRYLVDDRGKELFTLQELTALLESEDRQAVNQQIRLFRDCGEEFASFLTRQRKVDERVIAAVKESLLDDPLAKAWTLAYHANELLGRQDITDLNVYTALEQISCKEIREKLKKQIEQGSAHYQEEYVIRQLFEIALSNEAERPKIATINSEMIEAVQKATEPRGTQVKLELSSSNEAKKLSNGNMSEEQLATVWDSPLAWKIWALVLYLRGVSTADIGGWLGVNKSTICRWLDDVSEWKGVCLNDKQIASSGKAAVDEKYVKIDGVFWYLFAAMDCITGCPLHAALYPSNSGVYCRLFLLELKRLGFRPTVIITDGWDGYVRAIATVFPQAEHLYCRFHALKSLFRRLRKAEVFNSTVFKMVCKLFQTSYKRTVERRLDALKLLLAQLDVSHVMGGILIKWPKLIKTVGSKRLPSTANAVERFFGAFDRLYRLKGPFCDEASAQKHLRLFMLGYSLTIGKQGQACPLEKAGVDVEQIPLYHLLNRPNVIALKDRMAEQYIRKAS